MTKAYSPQVPFAQKVHVFYRGREHFLGMRIRNIPYGAIQVTMVTLITKCGLWLHNALVSPSMYPTHQLTGGWREIASPHRCKIIAITCCPLSCTCFNTLPGVCKYKCAQGSTVLEQDNQYYLSNVLQHN